MWPLPELDIIEEMLRPLVTAKETHERGNCFHIPIRAGFFQSDGVLGKGTKDSIAIRAQKTLSPSLNATPHARGRILRESKVGEKFATDCLR